MEKIFKKNDNGFICVGCGQKVEPLGYTSRDHCPECLVSLHVDVNPGDRKNNCGGKLVPIEIEYNSKKGYVIVYKCEKCNKEHKNKVAKDDNMEMVIKVMNKTY